MLSQSTATSTLALAGVAVTLAGGALAYYMLAPVNAKPTKWRIPQDMRVHLTKPLGGACFRRYCVKHLCDEMYDGWAAMTEFKQMAQRSTPETRRALFKRILDLYIRVDSEREVNIDGMSREQLVAAYENNQDITPEIFDEVAASIFSMLVLGKWIDYVESKWYAEYQELSLKNKIPVPSSNYVECLDNYDGIGLSIFLGGGISGCVDWQKEMKESLNQGCPRLVVVNPRRENFDTSNLDETPKQIYWEYAHLRKVTAIMFWFPNETLCPITLFELGQWCVLSREKGVHIFVGCDPDYARKEDVVVQLRYERPDIKVVFSRTDLEAQVKAWYTLYLP
eukprot:CAMPEP_0168537456 /NCGR_PEP_ID=MMETSP0405-20121227/20352_1 /TAXON_ID=498012 /ORGANISM="Trichosphaerium sp, Strain Am-I-7 wt" /LENGTH=336 /DNA_ID=CAMNT_0008566049 /DNA_START=56 /DNA_END=1066 /DNA_ORIENTATION=-